MMQINGLGPISLREVIHALSEAERDQMVKADIPTSPDTSLPWSENAGQDGWSAKMFLHQMISTSWHHWKSWDTERLLSGLTPLRLQAKGGSGISLSDQLKKPGRALPKAYSLPKTIVGLFRRASARCRSFRVLLRTERDTIPVIVTFGMGSFESLMVRSEHPLPAYLLAGWLDFLRRALQE